MTPRASKKQAAKFIRITQVRSRIGVPEKLQRVLIRGLGLGRIGKSVVLLDNAYTRGMIAKVPHLVRLDAYEE